ncbi:MAG: hypothetical protein LC739_13455 [Actinobacteria bacterium]|nr:hypothetical protein [Actinomycetota bacterium]
MRSQYRLAVVAVLVLVSCTPSNQASTTSISTTAPEPTTSTAVETTTALTLPEGTEELPEGLRAEIARLIPRTEELRELRFVSPPTITVLTNEELSQRVIEQIEEEYEDAEVDEALFRVLGLIGPEYDLLENLTALYGAQVAGYYHFDTKELVVTARNEEFSPLEEVTLVHELTHALTDQVHAFNDEYNELFDSERFDEGSAFQSVIEGDATLVESLFAQQLNPEEQQELLEEAFADDNSAFEDAPEFIQDSLIFPYQEGTAFTQAKWVEGGFAAIDALYEAPPISTEQILTPTDYPSDVPAAVDLPNNEIDGYEHSEGSVWGEQGFRLMFDQILGGADNAAEGWGGDSYDVYFNGADAVLVLLYQGDQASDAAEMASSLNDYFRIVTGVNEPVADAGPGGGAVYSGADYAFVSNVGDRVLLVAAGDPGAGAIARSLYPEF